MLSVQILVPRVHSGSSLSELRTRNHFVDSLRHFLLHFGGPLPKQFHEPSAVRGDFALQFDVSVLRLRSECSISETQTVVFGELQYDRFSEHLGDRCSFRLADFSRHRRFHLRTFLHEKEEKENLSV